jgi:outer membrane protein
MKRVIPLLCLFLINSGMFARAWGVPQKVDSSTSGITLQECYESARKISETVGISAENTRFVQEQYRAQIGAVLPHIDWIKSQFYQQNIGSSGSSGSAANTSLKPTQPLSYFQLQQPIFAGFRDWSAIAITKSQREQARLNEQATDLQLLSDVAAAFYAAYALQDQLSVLMETRKLNQEQVDQLNHWVNIGRSRPSEVLSAQTQLASLDAQIEDTKRTIAEGRHLLLFLTGVPADVPLTDTEPTLSGLTLDAALTRAGKRPDVLSTVEALHQAELGIRYARGAHLPTLAATGRYYTERIGFLSDVRWDATFLLDVPLYEGGSTQAVVREARSQEIIAQLTLGRLKRDIDRQVRTAYDDLSHAVSEVQAYDKAVQLAEKNFGVQQKENRLGVTTNLELLQLLTNMQNIRGQALISRANARLDDILLKVSMGEGL